jgi:EmrB/QacA subfamily drug resistance transporter
MSVRDQRFTLAAATLGSFVALLESTVVGVALPAISADLGGGLESQQWIVNAYLLALGALILIGGSLGDVFGERRVFLVGATGFGIASVACALAPTVETLIAARGLKGVFGALLTPASLAVIIAAFEPDERGKAIGTWTAFSGIAAVVGPLVGGWLVDGLGWRWIFAVNLPFIAMALLLAARMPAAAPVRAGRRPDWLGAGLCALGLAGPTLALVRQPAHGWSDALVAGPLVAGAVLFGLFLLWERRGARDPMLPLGLFGRSNFAWGNVETFFIYAALGLFFFVLVVFLQQGAGYSALEAGAATIPTTVVLFLFSKRFGALADRLGPRLFMTAGPIVAAAGVMYLLATIDESPALLVDILPGTTIFALGLAMLVSPLTAAVLADADERNAGIASGVNNAVARVAGLLATAAVGTIVGGTLDLGGLRTALAGTVVLLALGGLTGLSGIRNPRRVPAGRARRSESRVTIPGSLGLATRDPTGDSP